LTLKRTPPRLVFGVACVAVWLLAAGLSWLVDQLRRLF